MYQEFLEALDIRSEALLNLRETSEEQIQGLTGLFDATNAIISSLQLNDVLNGSVEAVVRALKRLRMHSVRPQSPGLGRPASAVRSPSTARRHPTSHSARRPPGNSGARTAFILLFFVLLAVVVTGGVSYWVHHYGRTSETPDAAAGAGNPAAPTSVPKVGGDAEWLQLKGRLGGIHDPRVAQKLLDTYEMTHQGRLPKDFSWYKKHFQNLVQKPARNDVEQKIETLSQAGANNRERVLREVAALLREKGLTPNQRQRLESLRRRFQAVDDIGGGSPAQQRHEAVSASERKSEALSGNVPPEEVERLAYLELLAALSREFRIDPDRVYLVGHSHGGRGVWDLAAKRPDLFAAAVPVCGDGNVDRIIKARRIPIWAFHGDRDAVIPIAGSRKLVAVLRAVGAPVRYTEYPNAGHDVWDLAFAEPDLPAWLFAQSRK
jgi:hypothetical protein